MSLKEFPKKTTSYVDLKTKDLTKLEEVIKSKNSMLLIYGNRCSYCINFKPVWESFTQSILKKTNKVQFFAIEIEILNFLQNTNEKLYNYITLTSAKNDNLLIPKLVVFKKNSNNVTRVEYKGKKSIENLTSYVEEKFLKGSNISNSTNASKSLQKTIAFPRGGQTTEKRNLNEQIMGMPRKHLPVLVDRMIAKYLGL